MTLLSRLRDRVAALRRDPVDPPAVHHITQDHEEAAAHWDEGRRAQARPREQQRPVDPSDPPLPE